MFEIKADENCCASRERGATVIVGAGTAGMSAAIELARHGVASTVVDESPKIGGVVYRGPLRMQGSCSHLDRKFKKTINAIQPDYEEFSSHINIKLNTQVLGAIDDNRRLALLDSERFYSIDYSRLIVATGCHERGVPFPGWTLPGVMTVGGAQLQVKSGLVKPGRRIALVGTGPLLLVAAKQLHLAGVEVIGVYESGRWLDLALNGLSLLSSLSLVAEGIGYRRFLKKAGIPFRYSWGLVEARGGRELEEVILAPLDRQWRPKKSQRETVAVDCLAVEYGFQSRSQLTQLLGMDHEFDESSGWRPVHDESGRTARVGTYVAGDAAGVFGGQVAAQQGKLAALAVLQDRGFSDRARVQREVGSVRKMLQKHMRFREAFTKFSRLRPGLLDLPAEDTVICRCENVTRAKIDRVLQQGVTDITTLKLETRAGMGDCQGKMCSSFCYDYMKRKLDTDDVGRLRPRFPLAPLIFGDILKGEKNSLKNFDIVIIGGGVVGVAAAYFLTRTAGLSVAVIDNKKPGNATRASAGGLWPIGESVGLGCGVIFFKAQAKKIEGYEERDIIPSRPHQLPGFFFDFCLKSNDMYPTLWEELKEKHNLDFKLEKTGLKFVLYDEFDKSYAEKIAASIPHLSDKMCWYDQQQLCEAEPFVNKDAVGALEFTSDGQLNPYLLNSSYREGARRQGASLFPNTEVTGVTVSANRVVSVETTGGRYGCGTVINAAGAWASDITRMVLGCDIPVSPVKGQVVLSEKMPRVLHSCISTNDCYIAQKDNGEMLIGSTTEEADFDTGCSYEELQALCRGAVKCLPGLRGFHIKRTWAGLRPGTPDEIPILGPVNGVDGYLNACGHFRTGILTSAITGKIIHSLVSGDKPPIDLTPFLLSRFGETHRSVIKHKEEEVYEGV